MKDIIIGAGFTGMAAGIRTGLPIYEAGKTAGGICGTYEKNGFTFSSGGPHWIFPEGNGTGLEFIRTLSHLKEYERKSSVYYNTFFPYPIQQYMQTDTHALTQQGTFQCWLQENFSPELNNMFFYPFNDKYTCGLYEETAQLDAYKTPKKGGTGTAVKFYDPEIGVNGVIAKMEDMCDIRYNSKFNMIDTKNKIAMCETGEIVRYDKIISTIPLDKMLEICGCKEFDLPKTSVLVINIGAKPGLNCPKDHWVYTPFSKSGMHRVAFYSNVDRCKAPKGKVGLSVEIATTDKFEDIDVRGKEENVLEEIHHWGWIKDFYTIDPTWVETAYSYVYKPEDRTNAIEWLKDRDIISTGRYGKWLFQGMTASIEDGLMLDAD